MSDNDLRVLERAALVGDIEARAKFRTAAERLGLELAVSRFLVALEAKAAAHTLEVHGGVLKPRRYRLDPGGQKFLRVVVEGGGSDQRSVYCFVERATGNLLKPGGWKAPEPKRIPRGNVYNADCLAGCGPYGVAYAGSSRGANIPWSLTEPVLIPASIDPRT